MAQFFYSDWSLAAYVSVRFSCAYVCEHSVSHKQWEHSRRSWFKLRFSSNQTLDFLFPILYSSSSLTFVITLYETHTAEKDGRHNSSDKVKTKYSDWLQSRSWSLPRVVLGSLSCLPSLDSVNDLMLCSSGLTLATFRCSCEDTPKIYQESAIILKIKCVFSNFSGRNLLPLVQKDYRLIFFKWWVFAWLYCKLLPTEFWDM